MGMRRLQLLLVSILGIALLVSIGYNIYQSTRLTELRQQRETASESLQQAQENLHTLRQQLAAARRKPPAPVNKEKAVIAQRDATINQLSGELTAAQSSITQLQQQLSTASKEKAKTLATATEHSREMEAKFQSRLNDLQKKLDTAQSNIQNSEKHITQLKEANAKLSSESSQGTRRLAEREHILNRLQDLDKRRESSLRSITERCRNITSQFRTMSGMVGSNRGQDSGAFSGAALDLIQNALTSTDNDFQHLSQLNAQAYRLEKKLAKL